MYTSSIDKQLALSRRNFASVESVEGYGLLRHAVCSTLAITPPFIGGVESVRAWRGPVGKKKREGRVIEAENGEGAEVTG